MNKTEATAILAIIKTAYPNFYKGTNEIDDAINLWAMMFENDHPQIVTEAVKTLMCTLKFPPTIADVKEKIALITQPQRMTEMEAWNIVRGAISYYNAVDNFASLPPTIQRLVGSPNQLREWAVMEAETVDSVIQSNFMRSFKARQQQEKELAMLPESTKQLIAGLSEKLSITDGRVR
jgi:hypothetical protein